MTEQESTARPLPWAESVRHDPVAGIGAPAATNADEKNPAISAGPIQSGSVHVEEVPAAKPDVRGAASLTAPGNAGVPSAADPSGKPGAVTTLPVPSAEAAASSSAALGDSSVSGQASASHEAAAKAKLRAAGEGIATGATTQAPPPSMAVGGPGSQTVSFIPRETGIVPAPTQSPAHPGIVPASTPHEAFAALDREVSGVAPTWIHAGAAHAEAGFEDPALGWVAVRAELGGSGVHASLVPGSMDAAQALGSHLAGLNDYLAEHYAGVSAVTLSAPESHSGDLGLGQSGAGAAHQGLGQQTRQGAGEEPGTTPRAGVLAPAAIASMPAGSRDAAPMGTAELTRVMGMEHGAGVYISVLA